MEHMVKCEQCNINKACWVNGTRSTLCSKCRVYNKHKLQAKVDDMIYRIREQFLPDENPADMWPEEDL